MIIFIKKLLGIKGDTKYVIEPSSDVTEPGPASILPSVNNISLEEQFLRRVRAVLIHFYNFEAKNMVWNQPVHLSAGDRCVINRYDLKPKSANDWDNGVNTIKNNSQPTDEVGYVTINKVEVNMSRVGDIINAYADSLDVNENNSFDFNISDEQILENFITWWKTDGDIACNNKGNIFHLKNFGMYYSAKYTPDNDKIYSPTGGMNINCFLPVDSFEGKATIELWESRIIIKNLERGLNDMQKAYNENVKTIQEKF